MFSVIDIESNGGGYRQECIIEVAIYRYDGHEIVDQFSSLVNPEADISAFVQKLTGITPKMVKTAPKFHEIAKRIVEITDGTTLVGHNIEFDYRMLRQSFSRLGYKFKINTLDTISLAQKLIPEAESYSLAKLVRSLGIPMTEHHRAGGDARATLDLFKLLMTKDKDQEIIQKQYEETNAKTYVNRVRDLTQDLPNARGIVYFQNAEGKILHSEYAEDINRCAKKLFHSKSGRYEIVQQQSQQVHYELVGNELIANLILASRGLTKRRTLPYGLYFKNGGYFAEKKAGNKQSPILMFKSYTQSVKAVRYLRSSPQYADYETLSSMLNFEGRNELWLLTGRSLADRTFITIENGRPTAFGFYEIFTQIQTRTLINQRQVLLPNISADLLNELKLYHLRGEIEIQPLPL